MDENKPVTIGPWGIVLGTRLRRTLLVLAGAVLTLAAFQTIMAIVWALTHRY